MSFSELLTHECDIYHLQSDEAGESFYGIPTEDLQETFSYPDKPDQEEVASYFAETSQTISQGEPGNQIFQIYKVAFEVDADIRVNDKVIRDGITYTLQQPNTIKDSHQEVKALRRVFL